MSIIMERAITVKNNKATLDNPMYLYVGDGDITCLFTINEIKKAARFGTINSTNLISEIISYGEIRIYKPDGELVFTSRAEVIDDRLQAIFSFENIDQLNEAGTHQLQIHLYDTEEGNRNRFTIPPIEINVLTPIGSDTDKIDYASTGFALLDSRGIEEPTFLDGSYNRTEWNTGDIITKNKMNKIEDAIDTLTTYTNETKEGLSNKADITHRHMEYATVYTMNSNFLDVNHQLDSIIVSIDEVNNSKADKEHLHDNYALLEHSHDVYATTTDLNNSISNALTEVNTSMSGKADLNHSHNEYALQSDITNIESDIGGLTTDMGTLESLTSGLQNTISENTSAINKVDSALNGLTLWYGTQEEYDAIPTYSETTLYFIKEE